MRALLLAAVAVAAGSCTGILGIPSEGEIGCPEPCTVTVRGRTVRAESLGASQLQLGNVTVRLTSVDPAQQVITNPDGNYSFTGLEPGTLLSFNLSVPQSDPDVMGLLDTLYVVGTTGTEDITIDLPVVQYRWLAQVAFQCGIFASLNEALFDPGTMRVNQYFQTRATIIGQVLEADGSPATLDRADVAAVVQNFLNYNQNPLDMQNPPAGRVCFLEPDTTAGEFKGVNANTTSSGRFVMFRARNDIGTGSGSGEVRIPGFPTAPLDVSSASIGFVRIRKGVGEPLPDRPRTFERDVYHYFADKTCSETCHRPPDGIGFMTAPRRLGEGGIMYPADWSASVEDVYNNLTKPFDTDCALGGTSAARVCKAMPAMSLLYMKPGGLITHGGFNLGTEDEMVVTVLRWIEDGALLR